MSFFFLPRVISSKIFRQSIKYSSGVLGKVMTRVHHLDNVIKSSPALTGVAVNTVIMRFVDMDELFITSCDSILASCQYHPINDNYTVTTKYMVYAPSKDDRKTWNPFLLLFVIIKRKRSDSILIQKRLYKNAKDKLTTPKYHQSSRLHIDCGRSVGVNWFPT